MAMGMSSNQWNVNRMVMHHLQFPFALYHLGYDDYRECWSHKMAEVSILESPHKKANQGYFKQELKLLHK